MTKLTDGQTVKLRRTSVFYSDDIRGGINPARMIGEVVEANNGNNYLNLRVTVRWQNGYENCYDEHDLDVIEQESE